MRRAVGPLTGIVSRVLVDVHPDTVGGLTHAVTSGPISTSRFSPVTAPALGGAAKIDPQLAEISALAEALERYSCGVYDPRKLIRATLSDLGTQAIDPRSLPLGSAAEYEEVRGRIYPFDPAMEIEWAAGRSLVTGELRYAPACMVYVPYRFARRSHILLSPISTGLAAGRTRDDATLAGLLEIIERDSLAVVWLNKLTVPTLDLSTLPSGPTRDLWQRLGTGGIKILCKLTTTDLGIPTVLLSAREAKHDGAVLVAHTARANLDLLACVRGALEELEQCREAIKNWMKSRGGPPQDGQLRQMEDFFCYYSRSDRLGKLDFLNNGDKVSVQEAADAHDGRSSTAQVSSIAQNLHNCGYEAIAVDITPVDVAECGLSVIRAIVPGLQPISFNQDFRHLGGQRVFEAPVRMGMRRTVLRESELNTDPMPAA
jgi:thiazole/oxazole-forming peptide maturase SagD family component